MQQHMAVHNSLAALAHLLAACRCGVQHTAAGLAVTMPESDGAPVNVACRRRDSDGGAWWFLTGNGEPLAEAHRVEDAAVRVLRVLARPIRSQAAQ